MKRKIWIVLAAVMAFFSTVAASCGGDLSNVPTVRVEMPAPTATPVVADEVPEQVQANVSYCDLAQISPYVAVVTGTLQMQGIALVEMSPVTYTEDEAIHAMQAEDGFKTRWVYGAAHVWLCLKPGSGWKWIYRAGQSGNGEPVSPDITERTFNDPATTWSRFMLVKEENK